MSPFVHYEHLHSITVATDPSGGNPLGGGPETVLVSVYVNEPLQGF